MNLQTLGWDHERLGALGAPHAMLPKIASSSDAYGAATLESLNGIAEILGKQRGFWSAEQLQSGEAKTLTPQDVLC